MAVLLKSNEDLVAMRASAAINVAALQSVYEAIKPGVTTGELDRIAYEVITGRGGVPAFLGYPPGSAHPYPNTITASVNEELVHGIPGDRVLVEGDIISIDCGTFFAGFVSDSAFTKGVGQISREAQKLLDVTEESLAVGISQAVDGNKLGDISHAIQAYVEGFGYNVVREYGGHGVGRTMHEDPHIPNWGRAGRGLKLSRGMTLALEPMVMTGEPETRVLPDHWTVVTADGSLCAHFEHTVAITANGPEILTKWD